MYTNNLNLIPNNSKIEQVCKVLVVDYEQEPNAFEVIKNHRSHYATVQIPIIVLLEAYNQDFIPTLIKMEIDDYLIKPIRSDELKIRINLAIIRAERNQSSNPLTKLPGSELINKTIMQGLANPLAILYIDLDNFKAYNDYYGYIRGDMLLLNTTKILIDAVSELGNNNDFIGNIGGDDFVIITTPDKSDKLAQEICLQFDSQAPSFYDEVDRITGTIITHNRQLKPQIYPIITLSIAIIHNQLKNLSSLAQIAELTAELKHYAKSKPNGLITSNYVKDRRKK